MYGYIYKTTNLINNKIYVGQHKANVFEPDVYIGSGTLFRRAVMKYGADNFKNELLCECYSQEDMDNKEIYWIDKLSATDSSIGYNITKGGFGGSGPMTEETKQKIAAWNTDKTLVNDGQICFKINKIDLPEYLNLGYSHGPLPYTRSEEFKDRIRSTNSGKIAMSKGNIRTRVNPELLQKYLDNGYIIGWVKEADKVINKRKKPCGEGKCKYMHKDGNYLLIPESRQEEYLNDGWIYGAKKGRKKFKHKKGYHLSEAARKNLSDAHKGNKPSPASIEKRKKTIEERYGNTNMKARGTVWISRDGKTKMIHENCLEQYLKEGWIKGRKG